MEEEEAMGVKRGEREGEGTRDKFGCQWAVCHSLPPPSPIFSLSLPSSVPPLSSCPPSLPPRLKPQAVFSFFLI